MASISSIITPLIIGIFFFGLPPTHLDFEPKAYEIPKFDRLTGALKENYRLSNAEVLYEGKLLGPESLAIDKGIIYTGTMDGCINKITGSEVVCFTKIKRCNSKEYCSRPLGMKFDKGVLYVADGFLGVFSIDVNTGSVTPLIMVDDLVGGKPVTVPDDLTITSDGIIYFSDATLKWNLTTTALSVIEHENSGRIVKFDTKTNTSSVLIDGLFFPNGIQLSKTEDSLLISEFSNYRILKHYLKSGKKGQTEVLTAVPGMPANIEPSKNGYWITLLNYHNSATSGFMASLNQNPFARRVIVRFQQSIASLLLFINEYWKSRTLGAFAVELQHFFDWLVPPVMYGMAVEIDEDGNFISSVQSPDGKHGLMSELVEYDGYLYGGSYSNSYILRMSNA